MVEIVRLPELLERNIGSESRDFAVVASRSQPAKMSLGMIIFGAAWLAFTSIFVVAFLRPLFVGKEVHFSSNNVPQVASPENLGPIIVPAMVIGVFVLAGLFLLGFGLYSMFRKGGYFVGTPSRLVHYNRGTIRYIDWEQFSGDIEVSGTRQKGNITLGMRTGKMVSRKNGPDRYVPDKIYISGVHDVHEIEQVCRKRIKENDPTPSQ
ncbi:MAG: hypothetical protein JW723_00015 [Bacteroidales bacterium]|nr:hypothetical protein [Bacteroidales bacterium]